MKFPRAIWPFAFLAACLIAAPKLVEAANQFYNASGTPAQGSALSSAAMRTEFSSIASGFDKMPALTSGTAVVVNGPGTALTNTVGTLALAGNFATTGAFNTTFVQQADTSLTLPAATDTIVGRASTDTFTNKTFDTSGTGNVFKINGVTISDVTGSGSVVLASNPVLVAPNLGTPSAINLTNGTGLPISTGVSGLGTGIATFLAMPSSANLLAALTTKTGTGNAVFSANPTFTGTATFNVANATAFQGASVTLSGNVVADKMALGGRVLSGETLGVNGNVYFSSQVIVASDDLFLSTNHGITWPGNAFMRGSSVSINATIDGINGVQLLSGATAWTPTSDERAKDGLVGIDPEQALADVLTWRTETGYYKNDPTKRQRQFLIAQDIQKNTPEAVFTDENGVLHLDYNQTIPKIVAAIKAIAARQGVH